MKATLQWMAFKPHDNVGKATCLCPIKKKKNHKPHHKATCSYSPRTYNHLEVSKYEFNFIGFPVTILSKILGGYRLTIFLLVYLNQKILDQNRFMSINFLENKHALVNALQAQQCAKPHTGFATRLGLAHPGMMCLALVRPKRNRAHQVSCQPDPNANGLGDMPSPGNIGSDKP